ncbi:MAG TPA: FAD-binding oxidoreductase [Usitatibacter sp.]|nr:FAD-binding oxidoreductase [Usitatibacter sp.]
MNRREWLKIAGAVPLATVACSQPAPRESAAVEPAQGIVRRVRPSDPEWPGEAQWQALGERVGGRLARVRSPLAECAASGASAACDDVFRKLRNPYYIRDEAGLTQALGWLDAWSSSPSAYVVAARTAQDVAAAVEFARERNLRLVVKGGGHSYQGTSNAPDSLLVWTRWMDEVALHDAFVPAGCDASRPQPAVSVGAGAIWMHVYDAVTARAGRYVQGGGCATVGVAGLVQSGGFGSHSKRFGTAAASLLEAEIVTADGRVRLANACTNPDLYWAIRGGGGGSFGVVTRLTLRTHELPAQFGVVFATIRAASDAAFRRLVERFLRFCSEALLDPHWGEKVDFGPRRRLEIGMVFQGLDRAGASAAWKPFFDWVASSPGDYAMAAPPAIAAFPAREAWNPEFLREHAAPFVLADDRAGAPRGNVYWRADADQAGQYLYAYRSAWVPAGLLGAGERNALVEALVAASRRWPVSLHFNKGLAGAPAEVLDAVRDTAMNPAVLDAFALAIVAAEGGPAYDSIPGHAPNLALGRRRAAQVRAAMDALRRAVPDAGSYVSESDFFEPDWQRSFWGPHYARLLAVKEKYDPAGLFFVHHGVGSEGWSADGFTRPAAA